MPIMFTEGGVILVKRLILINLILIMAMNLPAVTVTAQNAYKANGIPRIGLHELEGEVVAIDAGEVIICKLGVCFRLKMAPKAKITCNGLVSAWQSLRPVTPQAFFNARAVLNGLNQVIVLDGFYQGEECIIRGWRSGDEQLCLRLTSMVDHRNKWRFVKSDARLPTENWLTTGQEIYVLYDRVGQVRGVYLPD
jgi:hypothetical protein